ncbi:MAG: hypothetical protein IBX67_02980 [Dehalococcoidia bacterium]|nr:hypothetical protein [Dehalococcoidia bacterium]
MATIIVEVWGAGGAGGGSTNAGPFSARGGGGGGGGAYVRSELSVSGINQLTVVVGAGGVGVSGSNGQDGEPSYVGHSHNSIDALVLAAGGSGGTANTAGGSPDGGPGGAFADSIGQVKIAGEDGQPGGTCFTSCSGAGGRGANLGGHGGAQLCGAFVTADGNPGDAPGGGGGGGRTSQYNGARAGGEGADGKVVISWSTDPPQTYALTITSTAGGSVTTPGENVYYHAAGTVINLVATPDSNCWFVNWTSTVPAFANPGSATTTFTMPPQDVTVVANFQCDEPPTQYTLTITSTAGGSVTVPGEAVYSHTAGTIVNLVATADADCWFLHWSATAGSFGNPNSATTTFTMPAQNVVVTANFDCEEPQTYKLVIDSEAGGFVATPGEGQFDIVAGTVINLTATPLNGCYFEFWTATAGVFGNPWVPQTTYTMPAQDATIIAHFECVPAVTYTVTMAVAPPGAGTATDQPGSPYQSGATVTVSAVPSAGCSFVNWTAVPSVTFNNPNATTTTFTMPAQNVVVTANFVCDCPTISPQARSFDIANPTSVWTTINWNNGSVPVAVRHQGTSLVQGTDYTISYLNGTATLTILQTYLAGKLTALGQSIALTIRFDNDPDCDATLTITAIDTSVSVCATISPTERDYNLADPSDVTTLITWNDSISVASIYDGTQFLSPGTQFTVHPYNGTAGLSIKRAYLENRLTAAGQSVMLTITFNDNCVAYLTIRAIDEPIVVGLTGYPVDRVAVMMPWIAVLAAVMAGASLLALRRRRALL